VVVVVVTGAPREYLMTGCGAAYDDEYLKIAGGGAGA